MNESGPSTSNSSGKTNEMFQNETEVLSILFLFSESLKGKTKTRNRWTEPATKKMLEVYEALKKTGTVETSQKDGLVDCGINNSKIIVFLFFTCSKYFRLRNNWPTTVFRFLQLNVWTNSVNFKGNTALVWTSRGKTSTHGYIMLLCNGLKETKLKTAVLSSGKLGPNEKKRLIIQPLI